MSQGGVLEEVSTNSWKKCSTCKKPIPYGGTYYTCSVSTCNSQRTGYTFCGMSCFESHLPGARHRDAGAIEGRAPSRTVVRPSSSGGAGAGVSVASSAKAASPNEVLVIASRLKEFIQARGDMNTSASVMDLLSDHLRILCDRAIDHARIDGRKTVMDRDFEFLRDLK